MYDIIGESVKIFTYNLLFMFEQVYIRLNYFSHFLFDMQMFASLHLGKLCEIYRNNIPCMYYCKKVISVTFFKKFLKLLPPNK